MPVAYHMVHYRKCEGIKNAFAKRSFEEICRSALSNADTNGTSLWERAEDRLWNVQDDAGRQILLNKVVDLTSAIAGEMCLVQATGLQALLEMQASKVKLSNITLAEIFALNEKTAPEGSRFIRGNAVLDGNWRSFIFCQNSEQVCKSYAGIF